MFSSLAHSIVSYLSDEPVDYDFGLLSTAFALVYAYGLGWPALLWVALRYYGLGEWSMIEAIATWGYGQFVWIPVSVRCRPSNLQYNALTRLPFGYLVYLYRSFLNIEVGTHGGGLRRIRVLYMCKRISHSSNSTPLDYLPCLECVLLTISSGGLAREQDISHPDRPLSRSRRLPLQGDVL